MRQVVWKINVSERPKISTPREDRALVHTYNLQDRKLTSPHLKRVWEESCGVVCSASTIRKKKESLACIEESYQE